MNLQIFQQQDCLALETVLQFVVNISHSSNFHLWKMNGPEPSRLVDGDAGSHSHPSGHLEPFQHLSLLPAEQFVFAKIFCHLKPLSGREKQVLKYRLCLLLVRSEGFKCSAETPARDTRLLLLRPPLPAAERGEIDVC